MAADETIASVLASVVNERRPRMLSKIIVSS
jgi:hypothetical protein